MCSCDSWSLRQLTAVNSKTAVHLHLTLVPAQLTAHRMPAYTHIHHQAAGTHGYYGLPDELYYYYYSNFIICLNSNKLIKST